MQRTGQGFDCKSSEDQTGKEDVAGSIAVHSAFVSNGRLQVKAFYFCNLTRNRFNRRHVTREGSIFLVSSLIEKKNVVIVTDLAKH